MKSAPVKVLDKSNYITKARINTMMKGPIEQFRAEIGFANPPDEQPETATVALWLLFKDGSPNLHEFLTCGPPQNVEFELGAFAGHDGLPNGTPDTKIRAKLHLDGLRFKPGSNVTNWALLQEIFQESISTPGAMIDWLEGNPIYVRVRIEADMASNEVGFPVYLKLEGLPIQSGKILENFPLAHREVLESGAARTFELWTIAGVWHHPCYNSNLATTPGIHSIGAAATDVTDVMLRWHLSWIFNLTRRGEHTDGLAWLDYLEDPQKVHNPRNYLMFPLVIHTEENCPTTSKDGKNKLRSH